MERALKPGGLFIYDMNTIYGLAVLWQQSIDNIQQDTSEIDEIHQERGYPVAQMHDLLAACGFEVLACYGSLADLSEPEPDSGRVWFVARKGGPQNDVSNKELIQPHRRRLIKGNKIHKARI